jgi:hypothetical protein
VRGSGGLADVLRRLRPRHARVDLDQVVVAGAALTRRFLRWAPVLAVLCAPLVVGWSVGRTTVHDTIGITPATFTFTTTGHSEVRLGIAGTVYLPLSRGPLGVATTIDGPGNPQSVNGDLASFVTPQMLDLYSGLFHDPEPAVQSYVDELTDQLLHRLLRAEVLVVGLGGLLVALALPGTTPRALLHAHRTRVVLVTVAVAVGSCVVGVLLARGPSPEDAVPAGPRYALPVLDRTIAEGSTTDSPVLRLLLGAAVPKVHTLVQRQEERVNAYQATATASLRQQVQALAGPRAGETAVLMQSDMHCNTTMTRLQRQVVDLLRSRFGKEVPALLAITGDLTTNGTAAEGGCIRHEAGVAAGSPVVAVTGNHETEESVRQMRDAGMQVLEGAVREVAGVTVLGDGDPSRTELFGATALRGDETEDEMGARLRTLAEDSHPDLVLVHEAYAAQAFLRVGDMAAFLQQRGSATVPHDDGVPDVPAAAVFYGHWHRSVEPRVVWNSDGTWTLVMELDTSGGAVDTPTLNHYSTPWSAPQQEASFPVVFLDKDSGLVTGYQVYRFRTDGSASVLPRVDVGPPA